MNYFVCFLHYGGDEGGQSTAQGKFATETTLVFKSKKTKRDVHFPEQGKRFLFIINESM